MQAEEVETAQVAAFAKLAAPRGVERLVLLSARDWAVSGGEEALAGERAVQNPGTGWTVLRPTWFVQNFAEESFLPDPVLRGELVLCAATGSSRSSTPRTSPTWRWPRSPRPARRADLRAVGPAPAHVPDSVATDRRATGRAIPYRPVTPAEYRAHAAANGIADDDAAVLATLFGWIAAGRNAHLSDGVQRALGRAPRDFTDYVTATAPTGVWNPLREQQ